MPVPISKKASESSSGAIFANSSFQPYPSTQPGVSFLDAGSLVGRASGLGAPTDEPLKKPPNYHDIITFFPNTKDRIFAICAPLYAQGLSLREIERQTGFVKTTIKKTLNAGGLALRNYHNRQKPISQDPSVMKAGAIPFGYAYLEGQLVKDPREYKTLLQI